MHPHAAELRRCLEALDVAGVRRLWRQMSPHLPQPKDDAETLVTLHHARTQSEAIALKLRAWSHRWLLERGYPSGLPDPLKPSAERIYPRIVEGVGISVNFKSPVLQPIGALVRGAMEEAVSEAYADRKTEPSFVRARMQEAKATAVHRLVGLRLR